MKDTRTAITAQLVRVIYSVYPLMIPEFGEFANTPQQLLLKPTRIPNHVPSRYLNLVMHVFPVFCIVLAGAVLAQK